EDHSNLRNSSDRRCASLRIFESSLGPTRSASWSEKSSLRPSRCVRKRWLPRCLTSLKPARNNAPSTRRAGSSGRRGTRLRCDHDLERYQRLPGRPESLLPEAVDVELEGAPGTRDSLAPRATVNVTPWHLGHRRNEPPVLLPVDRHHVAELHDAQDGRQRS